MRGGRPIGRKDCFLRSIFFRADSFHDEIYIFEHIQSPVTDNRDIAVAIEKINRAPQNYTTFLQTDFHPAHLDPVRLASSTHYTSSYLLSS